MDELGGHHDNLGVEYPPQHTFHPLFIPSRGSSNPANIHLSCVALVNWLDHNKTLREQSVDVSETLLLRRKYFFSDQNVDARDPVQLNLLYVQVPLILMCKYFAIAAEMCLISHLIMIYLFVKFFS